MNKFKLSAPPIILVVFLTAILLLIVFLNSQSKVGIFAAEVKDCSSYDNNKEACLADPKCNNYEEEQMPEICDNNQDYESMSDYCKKAKINKIDLGVYSCGRKFRFSKEDEVVQSQFLSCLNTEFDKAGGRTGKYYRDIENYCKKSDVYGECGKYNQEVDSIGCKANDKCSLNELGKCISKESLPYTENECYKYNVDWQGCIKNESCQFLDPDTNRNYIDPKYRAGECVLKDGVSSCKSPCYRQPAFVGNNYKKGTDPSYRCWVNAFDVRGSGPCSGSSESSCFSFTKNIKFSGKCLPNSRIAACIYQDNPQKPKETEDGKVFCDAYCKKFGVQDADLESCSIKSSGNFYTDGEGLISSLGPVTNLYIYSHSSYYSNSFNFFNFLLSMRCKNVGLSGCYSLPVAYFKNIPNLINDLKKAGVLGKEKLTFTGTQDLDGPYQLPRFGEDQVCRSSPTAITVTINPDASYDVKYPSCNFNPNYCFSLNRKISCDKGDGKESFARCCYGGKPEDLKLGEKPKLKFKVCEDEACACGYNYRCDKLKDQGCIGSIYLKTNDGIYRDHAQSLINYVPCVNSLEDNRLKNYICCAKAGDSGKYTPPTACDVYSKFYQEVLDNNFASNFSDRLSPDRLENLGYYATLDRGVGIGRP